VVQAIEETAMRCLILWPANHVQLAHPRAIRVLSGGRVGGGPQCPLGSVAATIPPIVIRCGPPLRRCSAQGWQTDSCEVARVAGVKIGPGLDRLVPQVSPCGVCLRSQGDLGVPPRHPSVNTVRIVTVLRRPALWHVTPLRWRGDAGEDVSQNHPPHALKLS
jgi:hypothetical protein